MRRPVARCHVALTILSVPIVDAKTAPIRLTGDVTLGWRIYMVGWGATETDWTMAWKERTLGGRWAMRESAAIDEAIGVQVGFFDDGSCSRLDADTLDAPTFFGAGLPTAGAFATGVF